MPPRQATLGAYFRVDRPAKRVRTEAAPVDGADAAGPGDSGGRPPPPAPSNPTLAALQYDASDTQPRKTTRARHAAFSRVVGTARERTLPAPGTAKYTPLEKQILALKEAHPGVLLLVEVGYKMKFYQEDARIASRILHINLEAAMVPVPRLTLHVKRLVAAGYKVGVCRQMETRALKSADNPNTPFTRKLTALYTATTYIDEVGAPQDADERGGEQVLLTLLENDHALGVEIGLAAVDVATASVTYDTFVDDPQRSHLATRLAHLAPKEIALAHVRTETARAVQAYAQRMQGTQPLRRETIQAMDAKDVVPYLTSIATDWDAAVLRLLLSLPLPVQCAVAQLAAYLTPYALTDALRTPENYRSFTDRTSMLLSSHTLYNLELMRNATDGEVRGSLFWHVDHCRTPMGKRLLRQWLRRPLLDADQIAARASAVDTLRERRLPSLHQAAALLIRLPDLARGLARIAYQLVEPTELVTVLLSLHRVTREFPFTHADEVQSGSPLLDTTLAALSTARGHVATHLDAIHVAEARKNAKTELFVDPDRYPAITRWKAVLEEDETKLEEHLHEVRAVLGRPKLAYFSVAGIENLIEVRTADASKTPADWVRVNSTKVAVRFHTPTVLRLAKLREQHREQLAAEGRAAFADFVQGVARDYAPMYRVVCALAELDALHSLAEVASLPGYTRPTIVTDAGDDELLLHQFRHPVVEAIQEQTYVPNDLGLGGEHPRAVLLTGANMGGKSSTARAIALIVVLAQMGSFVPCASARIPCHDAIATRMGAQDDLVRGKSTFMVEAEETAQMLRIATPRSLLLLDEFGRGTSTFDGAALAHAVLTSMLVQGDQSPKVLFITHYTSLGTLVDEFPGRIAALHMATHVDTHAADPRLVFLHALRKGIAPDSLGVHVARLAELPRALVQAAQQQSHALRTAHAAAGRRRRAAALVGAAFGAHDIDRAVPLARSLLP